MQLLAISGTPELVSKSAAVGEMNVSVEQIEKLPYIFGEKDVLKLPSYCQVYPKVVKEMQGFISGVETSIKTLYFSTMFPFLTKSPVWLYIGI